MPGTRVVALRPVPHAAATFHGRDVYAPAAAALAPGAALDGLGNPCDDPIVRRTADAHRLDERTIVACGIAVDRFGSLITNRLPPRNRASVVIAEVRVERDGA